jgi:hypothetical protein
VGTITLSDVFCFTPSAKVLLALVDSINSRVEPIFHNMHSKFVSDNLNWPYVRKGNLLCLWTVRTTYSITRSFLWFFTHIYVLQVTHYCVIFCYLFLLSYLLIS